MKSGTQKFRTSLLLLGFGLSAGCGVSESATVTRLHLENASDSPLTFIAVGFSEHEVEKASNRLPKPLEPDSVYSAILSRPGNYWVRMEFEEGGHTIERIAGPLRVSRGILDWQFTALDVRPLYEGHDQDGSNAGGAVKRSGLAIIQPAAGRISFSNN